MIKAIKKIYIHFSSDSLYRNSIYLMATTFLGAFVGFFFWIINTRLFSPEQIGIATALISSTSLIAGFSMLGLNTGIIRYLPKAKDKSLNINTVVNIIFIASLLMSIFYIIGLQYFAPKLIFLRSNIIFISIFIIFTTFIALDSIYSSVFVSYRMAKYIFLKSIIGNILKLILPLLLIGIGSFALYTASLMGSLISVFISIYLLTKNYKYIYKFKIDPITVKKIFSLSFGNYVASFLSNLPLQLLPILIINKLGSKETAIFYLDLMIINLLNTIQQSVGQSLFAEGSNNDKNLRLHVIKAIKFIGLILVPAILVTIFLGKYILLVFGKVYSNDGIALLQLLASSVIFTSINGLLSTILNVKGKVKLILLMCVIGPVILLAFIYFLLPGGLISLGYAWLFGEALISVIYLIIVYFKIII